MTAFFQSPFLSALGWALANSLWQMALLWLLFQLCIGVNKKMSPRMTYLGALVFMLGGFIWFGITFAQQYAASSSISGYLANLPQVDEGAAATTAGTAGTFSFAALLSLGEKYLPYLSASYLIILVILFVRLANAYGYSQEVRTRGLIKIDYNWRIFVKDFANRIGIRREVAIYLSELIDVPATMGWLKPVILLPVATFTHLSPAQVEAVILHELSHIKRNDYLVNLLISVVETILFFNPFCQLLASTIKKERENCCDDFVIQLRCDPGSYAAALLSLEKMRVNTQQQLAMAATGNKNQLLGRVKRILNVKSRSFNYGQKLTALMLTAFILSSFAWLSPDEKSKSGRDLQQQAIAKQGGPAAESSALANIRHEFAKQSLEKRKIAAFDLSKTKINLAPIERELRNSGWEQKDVEPGFFSYRVPDRFAGFSKDVFEKHAYNMKAPEWNAGNLFVQPNPEQEAWIEANRTNPDDNHGAEYPRVYYSMPPGVYNVQPNYADSQVIKKYFLNPDNSWNQNWNLALEQLQMKMGELDRETENLSKDESDLLKNLLEIQINQNGPELDLINPPSEDQVKKSQNDSGNFKFRYHFDMDKKKLRDLNAESLEKMKNLSTQQATELKKKILSIQREREHAIANLWSQQAKMAQDQHQMLMEKNHAMQYNEFLQRVNPGHGEYQEKTETHKRVSTATEQKIKISVESEEQQMLRSYRDRTRNLEDYQRMLEMQQKRALDRQKGLEDQKLNRKKTLEESDVILNLDGTNKISSDNNTIIFATSSNSKDENGMKVMFTLTTKCVESPNQNMKPVIMTVKSFQKPIDVKGVEPKTPTSLRSINL